MKIVIWISWERSVGSCEQLGEEKKASESLNIVFVLLLSYWKKRISTTCILQVYTAKFILKASVSKRNPQRRQDIVDSALLETYHVRAAQ